MNIDAKEANANAMNKVLEALIEEFDLPKDKVYEVATFAYRIAVSEELKKDE